MTRQKRRGEPDCDHNVTQTGGFQSRRCELCRVSQGCAATSGERNRRPPGAFVGAEHPMMHIPRGSPMTQSFDRRPSSRVAGALAFVVAVLLMLAMDSIAANAQTPGYQTPGYASTQPGAYPAD